MHQARPKTRSCSTESRRCRYGCRCQRSRTAGRGCPPGKRPSRPASTRATSRPSRNRESARNSWLSLGAPELEIDMLPSSRTWILVLAVTAAACGGGSSASTPSPTTPTAAPLNTASFLCSAQFNPVACGQTTTVNKSSLFSTGWNPSCGLRAGSAPMAFTAGSSSTWFTVSPPAGNLQPNGSTAIGITAINVAALPVGNNTGFVIVSASGYAQVTGLSIAVDCSAASTCRVSYTCP